jgi:hypothetical protein
MNKLWGNELLYFVAIAPFSPITTIYLKDFVKGINLKFLKDKDLAF